MNYWPIEYQNISHEGSEGQFCLAGGCKEYVFSSLKFQFSSECLGSGAPSRSAQVPYVHVFFMNFFKMIIIFLLFIIVLYHTHKIFITENISDKFKGKFLDTVMKVTLTLIKL